MDAEARQQAIHQLIEDWLAFPDHRATDFTTLEARIDRFVADAVAAERERLATGLDARAAEYERKRAAQVFAGIESSEGTWYRGLRVAVLREAKALRARAKEEGA